jgi:thiol-disulfide isomerase/thioredoxin
MEGRRRPPDGPVARGEAAQPALPAAPAIPAVPLVPPKPAADAAEEPAAVVPLNLGDAAPPISIANWVAGEPIEGFAEGSVTVVEFWATWCGPCRTSMPHISELQEQYGDAVRFVGVTREELGVVEEFLGQEQSEGKTWAEVIGYRLAIDDGTATNTAYMMAAGQNGIPCAFIVGKSGLVEWVGHPMTIDEPLEAIVNDSYDREAAVAEMEAEEKIDAMSRELFTLQREEKWDEALAMLETIQQELNEAAAPYNAQRLLSMRLDLLSSAGRSEDASALRGELVESGWDEPQLLNELAWNTAVSQEPSTEDLEIALKAATRAAELTDHADGSILDTLARVYYEMGDLSQAIAWQEKAVEHSEGNPSIEQILKSYRSQQAGGDGDTPAADLDSEEVTIEVF